jgi:hypothetical protein
MKTFGRYGIVAPPFLTPALDGGEWLLSHPGRFTAKEETALCTHWRGRLVGLKAGLEAVK